MDEFSKYSDDFKLLVNAVHETYLGKPPCSSRKDLAYLIQQVQTATNRRINNFFLEREEVEQELACMWLLFLRSYRSSKTSLTLKQYLIRRSIFGLRDWFLREMSVPSFSLPIALAPLFQFDLDLHFLLRGESWRPLVPLNAYERYLIYLKFVEGKDMLHIAKSLQKDRKTVSKQFKETMETIRSLANVEKNASRFG